MEYGEIKLMAVAFMGLIGKKSKKKKREMTKYNLKSESHNKREGKRQHNKSFKMGSHSSFQYLGNLALKRTDQVWMLGLWADQVYLVTLILQF